MGVLSEKNHIRYQRGIPYVVFDESKKNEIMVGLDLLFGITDVINNSSKGDITINEYMGYFLLTLSELGFNEEEKKIIIFDFDKDKRSFKCKKSDGIYLIQVAADMERVIVSIGNREYHYEYEESPYREIGICSTKVQEVTKCSNGIGYIRDFSREYMRFAVFIGDYFIELELLKPDNVVLGTYEYTEDGCRKAYYKLSDSVELKLRDYLLTLKPDGDIDVGQVLNKVCECLGDVNGYPKFILRRVRKENNVQKIKDIVLLEFGKVKKIGKSSNDITVILTEDGGFSFESLYFSMTLMNGQETYKVTDTSLGDLYLDTIVTLKKMKCKKMCSFRNKDGN